MTELMKKVAWRQRSAPRFWAFMLLSSVLAFYFPEALCSRSSMFPASVFLSCVPKLCVSEISVPEPYVPDVCVLELNVPEDLCSHV